MIISTEKAVQKYLGFLITEYSFDYDYLDATDYCSFCGPSETYSFHNEHGCFTVHHLCQRDEWGWFYSPTFSQNQSELLIKEIRQGDHIKGPVLGYRSMLKKLKACIRSQIERSGSFFDIKT